MQATTDIKILSRLTLIANPNHKVAKLPGLRPSSHRTPREPPWATSRSLLRGLMLGGGEHKCLPYKSTGLTNCETSAQ